MTAPLNRSIHLLRVSRTSDGRGGTVETETALGYLRGALVIDAHVPLTADADRIFLGPRRYRCIIEARPPVDPRPSDWVVIDGRRFRIVDRAFGARTQTLFLIGEG